jgi:hypothetical protein
LKLHTFFTGQPGCAIGYHTGSLSRRTPLTPIESARAQPRSARAQDASIRAGFITAAHSLII